MQYVKSTSATRVASQTPVASRTTARQAGLADADAFSAPNKARTESKRFATVPRTVPALNAATSNRQLVPGRTPQYATLAILQHLRAVAQDQGLSGETSQEVVDNGGGEASESDMRFRTTVS